MTRKDFVLIAEALLSAKPDAKGLEATHNGWRWAVVKVSDKLAASHPRFDRDRFIRAATGESRGAR